MQTVYIALNLEYRNRTAVLAARWPARISGAAAGSARHTFTRTYRTATGQEVFAGNSNSFVSRPSHMRYNL